MEFAGPSSGVVEMFVFFVFDLLVSLPQRLLFGACQGIAGYSDQFPIHVVFCFGQHDTLRRDNLEPLPVFPPSGRSPSFGRAPFRNAGQRSARRVLIRIHSKLLDDIGQDRDVILRLI